MKRGFLAILVVIVFSLGAYAGSLELSVDSGMETVFASSASSCAKADTPDAPAHAFRDGGEYVHLFANHFDNNRALVGPSADRVERDCRVVFRGSDSNLPDQYDNRTWLTGFYTQDGQTVYALGHNEFHGELNGLCPKPRWWSCWYNTIVSAVSEDSGKTFYSQPSPDNLVAAAPYRFNPHAMNRTGAFNPTNIIHWNGFYFVLFVFSSPDSEGVCVMRTEDLANPKSWRAWDGNGFNVSFIDPYRSSPEDPKAHTCAPLLGLMKQSIGALVRHEGSDLFVAVQTATSGKDRVGGVYYSTSPDLVNWTPARLLLAVPTFRDFKCDSDVASYGYASLLDPASPTRNFETIGSAPYLYLTRFNLGKCRIGISRDLVRLRLAVELG